MRTSFIIATLSISTLSISAQKLTEKEIPQAVKDSFVKNFPNTKAEKWEKENADYEAEFDLNKIESSAIFGADGNFKSLEQEIKANALPQNIVDYCEKKIPESQNTPSRENYRCFRRCSV